jgi:UDP-glucose 4-epimerase
LLEDSPLVVHGDGRQTRDFIYVSDVADAIWRASTREASREKLPTLSIGSGVATSIVELAGHLSVIAGKTPTLSFTSARKADPRESCLDPAEAKVSLGWSPRVELFDGLARTYEWFGEEQATLDSAAASVVTV